MHNPSRVTGEGFLLCSRRRVLFNSGNAMRFGGELNLLAGAACAVARRAALQYNFPFCNIRPATDEC